jgi:DNA-binding XRE family transcriptional regulator
MNIQTIVTEAGEELVVLSRRAFDALMARAGDEDAEDRMTLIIAAEARGAEPLPEPVSAAVLSGDSPLKAIRRWRGMTQAKLASLAEIQQGYLSALEAGLKTGSAETLAALARNLAVPPGWLAG